VFYSPDFVDHVIGSVKDVNLPFRIALEEYIENLKLNRLELNMFLLVADEVEHKEDKTIVRFSTNSLLKTRLHCKAERWMLEFWLKEAVENMEIEMTIDVYEFISKLLRNEASDYIKETDDWKDNLITAVELLQGKDCNKQKN
jgi:hypothetical protein